MERSVQSTCNEMLSEVYLYDTVIKQKQNKLDTTKRQFSSYYFSAQFKKGNMVVSCLK